MLEAAAIIIGYLLGSFPTAYIAGRIIRGIDIRRVGVGNMGAANVFREIGKVPGVIVSAIDIAKGSVSVLIALLLLQEPLPWLTIGTTPFYPSLEVVTSPWALCAGFAAVLGHNYPVYIGFRGGKGAATYIGTFLVIAWLPSVVLLGILVIAYLFVHRIFLALWCMSLCSPFAMWVFTRRIELVIYILVTLVFMGMRTLPNNTGFQRFVSGLKDRIRDAVTINR